jgi:hypothetical protein
MVLLSILCLLSVKRMTLRSGHKKSEKNKKYFSAHISSIYTIAQNSCAFKVCTVVAAAFR